MPKNIAKPLQEVAQYQGTCYQTSEQYLPCLTLREGHCTQTTNIWYEFINTQINTWLYTNMCILLINYRSEKINKLLI